MSTVTAIATADTTSTRRRDELARAPIQAPAALNSPASRATSASTNTAARNASVGARRSSVSPTSSIPTSPVTTTSTAAGPATHRSGTLPHATSARTAASTSKLPAVATTVGLPNRCARQVRMADTDSSSELVAVLGGGQLGRMLGLAGIPLGLELPLPRPVAGRARRRRSATSSSGALGDEAALAEVARDADVVDLRVGGRAGRRGALPRRRRARAPGRPVARGVAGPPRREGDVPPARHRARPRSRAVDDRAGLDARGRRGRRLPAVLKTRRGGYDGKGQRVAARRRPTSTTRGPSSAACR